MWMVLHCRPPISPCPRCVQAVKVQLMMVAAAHYISYSGRGTKVYCDCRESGCWAGWIINVRGSAIILGVVILSTTLELPTLQDIKHNNTDTACSALLKLTPCQAARKKTRLSAHCIAKLIKSLQRWQIVAAISYSKQCNRIHQENKLSLPSLGCKLCRGSQWRNGKR